jgi:hypothetical protein
MLFDTEILLRIACLPVTAIRNETNPLAGVVYGYVIFPN